MSPMKSRAGRPVHAAPAYLFPLLLVLGLVYGARGAAASPVLLSASETVLPGETANIQGGNFSPSAQAWLEVIDAQGQPGQPQPLPILSQSVNLIQTQIPASVQYGVWAVWVSDGPDNSNVKFVNRPRPVLFDTPDVMPGGTFRIFGRNMIAQNGDSTTCAVQFVDGTGLAYPAAVTGGTSNSLTIKAPAGLPAGASYKVYVSNGLGGAIGSAAADASLPVRPASTDSWNLGVSWAGDYVFHANRYDVLHDPRLKMHAVGDGVHDDTAALQAALDTARKSSTGGVVYLPAGTYRIADTNTLVLGAHSVLYGDGPDRTTLLYATTAAQPSKYWLHIQDANLSGLCNLTVKNLNTSRVTNGVIRNASLSGTSEFFLNNVDLQLGNGFGLSLPNVDRLLISNSTISTQCTQGYALDLSNGTNVTMRNSSLAYRNGRIQLAFVNHAVVENNSFLRDGKAATQGARESGGIQPSFGRDIVLLHNTISLVGGTPYTGSNDGEAVMTQMATHNDFQEVGTASAAGVLSLTDRTKSWTNVSNFVPASTVAITDGPGMGQWRTITAHTNTGLTIDRPWDIVPPAGSHYAIGSWSCYQLFVLGNTLQNNLRGIELYNGAWDSVIDGNTLLSSGEIMLRAAHRTWLPSDERFPSKVEHDLVWNTSITNNKIVNGSVPQPPRIEVLTCVLGSAPGGNCILGAEVRGNAVTSAPTTLLAGAGYWNSVNWNYSDNVDPFVILGSIFDENSFSGRAQAQRVGSLPGGSTYHINSNTTQTAVDGSPAS